MSSSNEKVIAVVAAPPPICIKYLSFPDQIYVGAPEDLWKTDYYYEESWGLIYLITYKEQMANFKLHYLNWKILLSTLPQQDVLSSRHPTPRPFLHVNLVYQLVGLLNNWRAAGWQTTDVGTTDNRLTWARLTIDWRGQCTPVVVGGVRHPTIHIVSWVLPVYTSPAEFKSNDCCNNIVLVPDCALCLALQLNWGLMVPWCWHRVFSAMAIPCHHQPRRLENLDQRSWPEVAWGRDRLRWVVLSGEKWFEGSKRRRGRTGRRRSM